MGQQIPDKGFLNDTHWRVHSTKKNEFDWTDGFFAGTLWQLYRHTGNVYWRNEAQLATDEMYPVRLVTDTHDVGFMIMCSYGEAWNVTGSTYDAHVIGEAAHHLALRFNGKLKVSFWDILTFGALFETLDKVGCLRSWGSRFDEKEFLVIADNMMNLELLFQASLLTGNKTLYSMGVSHANRTLHEHIRADGSSFHVVNFNPTNGQVISKFTRQGYSNSSCWSRGQAWLLNGFATTYHFTKMDIFLRASIKLADYFLDHSPEDGVPPWDFDVPHSKYAYIPRDASAGAVAAVGLFELYGHTQKPQYLKAAHRIVASLSSEKYLANGHASYRLPALLANSTIAGPNGDHEKSDVALIYADYYMLKALKYLERYPL